MNFEKLPSRPVVKSQLSAEHEFRVWLRENSFERVKDKDGQEWQVTLDSNLQPDGSWLIKVALSADVDGSGFVRTGILKSDDDARLLEMLEDQLIPLRMRPREYRADDEEAVQEILAAALPALRDEIRQSSLVELKRTLISRWVDARCAFSKRY